MKKKILSIALVLAGLVGSTAFAQAPAGDGSQKEKTEKTFTKKDKKDKAQRPNPFEGINLTDKQKSELQALRDNSRAEKMKADEKKKADKKAEMKEMMEKRQNARKDYLAKIKGILTPEQYVQFLENSFLNTQQPRAIAKKGGKDMRPGKNGKDGKMGKRDGKRDGQRDGKRNAPGAQGQSK